MMMRKESSWPSKRCRNSSQRRCASSSRPARTEAAGRRMDKTYSPRDIEEKITRKIEDIIGTVPDVSRITSYASPSSSYTRIEFRTGTRLREAYAAVSDRMDRVKPLLPDDVDRIYVRRYDPSSEPMMNLVAQVPREMDEIEALMKRRAKIQPE